MSEVPLSGVYDFRAPGQGLELYHGEGMLDGVPIGTVRIWVPMQRRLKIRWQADFPQQSVDIDSSVLAINHPQLGRVEVPVCVNHSDGWGISPGTELGDGRGLKRVVAHWVNLPPILPTKPLRSRNSVWAGRWQIETCGWRLTLDSRRDHTEVLKTAAALDEEFVMTHVAELCQVDQTEFEASTASRVLFGWQLAISFALGRWVAPAAPVGFTEEEHKAWEQWVPWRCDTARGYQSWWDTNTGDDLASFVDAYLSAYLDPGRHDEVRWMAMHVISANHAGTTAEGKVTLAQAGLEYLGWVALVLSGRMSRRAYKDMKSAARLRQLLAEAEVPLAVPQELPGLFELAQLERFDGPDATAWVRNQLVHPKDAGEPYRIENLVWQAAQLLLEYGELLLLHRLNYRGRFIRRYPPNRWAHSSEPVPWA